MSSAKWRQLFCLGLNRLESVWISFIDIYFEFPRGQWGNVLDKNEETNVIKSCFSLFDIGHFIMHSPWVFTIQIVLIKHR